MAQAIKCSRCGAFEEGDGRKGVPDEAMVSYISSSDNRTYYADLCAGCRKRLKKWLDEFAPVEERK